MAPEQDDIITKAFDEPSDDNSTADIQVALPRQRMQRQVSISFSSLQSTDENYRVSDREFYGPFAHIREHEIDYSYHSNYKISRQRFQNCVIWELLEPGRVIASTDKELCTQPTEPWCVFVAGAFGSNKRKTIVSLVEEDKLPLLSFCYIDKDEISRHFPEYHVYSETVPKKAMNLTKKEAGLMSEILLWAALEAGKNVLYSGRLKATMWYGKLVQRIRSRFPNVKIAILHIDAPLETLKERVADRVLTTGFVASDEDVVIAYEQVPKSVAELAPMADYVCKLINSSKGIEISDQTWDSFRSNWYQTCAWRPGQSMIKVDYHMQSIQQQLHVSSYSFSLLKSTEENYKSEDMTFYSLYANIRERLDYSYH